MLTTRSLVELSRIAYCTAQTDMSRHGPTAETWGYPMQSCMRISSKFLTIAGIIAPTEPNPKLSSSSFQAKLDKSRVQSLMPPLGRWPLSYPDSCVHSRHRLRTLQTNPNTFRLEHEKIAIAHLDTTRLHRSHIQRSTRIKDALSTSFSTSAQTRA